MRVRRELIELVIGVGRVVVLAAALAVICGIFWNILDWMRTYGTGIVASPFADQAPLPPRQRRFFPAGTALGSFEDLIELYNISFRGGLRLGSGIGLVAGAFLALGPAKRLGLAARIATGITAGSIFGGRAALMITSDTPIFLGGALIGAVLTAWYLAAAGGERRFPPLPLISPGQPIT